MAADFELTTSDGDTIRLSDYKGKVVVLDFWATWCPPCREEIPGFIKLKKDYESKGVEVIGVVVSDEWHKVDAFAEKYGINYPIVMGDPTVVRNYGNFQGIPTTFVIDQEGIIQVRKTGLAPHSFFVKSRQPPVAEWESSERRAWWASAWSTCSRPTRTSR
jgi:cytochrome c biogenesis protein CcmG/thiol:disulfide interchange protein DsbE